jgi:phosphohistidine phosphatase
MELFLIRHGIAADPQLYTDDRERPLTVEGRQKTAKVAQRLHHLGLRFDLILTSPLVRAKQTAEILQDAGLSSQIEEFAELEPGGDIQAWSQWLESWCDRTKRHQLALVGHQPDLGNWAEVLVWGDAKERLVVKKAGVMGLNLPKKGTPLGQSQLFWLSSPKWL